MEIAKLVLEYVRVFIWPVTILVIVLLFRIQIRNLFSRIIKANFPGGVSIETLPEELKEARRLSNEVREDDRKPHPEKKNSSSIPLTEANARMLSLGFSPSQSGLEFSYYRTLAEDDPNLALAGLRIEVEMMLKNVAKGFKVPLNSRDGVGIITQKLKEHGAITYHQFELIMAIVKLCNEAIHGRKVTTAQANEILDIATVLIDQYIEWLSWGFPDGWKPSKK